MYSDGTQVHMHAPSPPLAAHMLLVWAIKKTCKNKGREMVGVGVGGGRWGAGG